MKSNPAALPAKAKEPSASERAMVITLYNNGQFGDALPLARDLTKRFPKHVLGWKVLGASLKKLGQTPESLEPMQKAVLLGPKDPEAFNNLGVTLKDLGRIDNAIGCYRQALALKPDYGEAHGNLGAALRDQGKLKEALACYRKKQQLMPDDQETAHHVASLSGDNTHRAPTQYVEGVFNNYADKFDAHLLGTLQYDVPQRLAELVTRLNPPPSDKWRVLDLGCGTGLAGQAMAPHSRHLVGVDLAAKMLDKAAAKGVYQRLACADLVGMMQAEPPASYDVLISADVFIYVGALDDVIPEVKRVLAPGGLFAFSVESLHADGNAPPSATPSAGFQLKTSGRYGHALDYLTRLAHQHHFNEVEMAPAQIRASEEGAIMGHLLVWQAP